MNLNFGVKPLVSCLFLLGLIAASKAVHLFPSHELLNGKSGSVQLPTYNVCQLEYLDRENAHIVGVVEREGSADGRWGNWFSKLRFEIELQGDHRAHFKMVPVSGESGQDHSSCKAIKPHVLETVEPTSDAPHWEVPESVTPRLPATGNKLVSPLKVQLEQEPFSVRIVDERDGAVLLDLQAGSFAMAPQFVAMNARLPEGSSVFGNAESTRAQLAMQQGETRTLWNRDTPAMFQDTNLYGSHPFALVRRKDGRAHGTVWVNSNGQDHTLEGDVLQSVAIGGVIDVYVLAGNRPDQVVQQFTGLVGRPHHFPLWSLGWHQCRYGYATVEVLEEVVANYSKANIPLDAIWADIDYMDNFKDWTWDEERFPKQKVKQFSEKLHANDQHLVVIVDPGIKIKQGYQPFEKLIATGSVVADVKGNPFEAMIWSNVSVFVDYYTKEGNAYWKKEAQQFVQDVGLSGLWTDMNEASNFCTGEYPNHYPAKNCDFPTPAPFPTRRRALSSERIDKQGRNLASPPYTINNGAAFGGHQPLDTKAVSPNALHANGFPEYDAHNTFGLTETLPTFDALLAARPGKRPFILTRSSFLGSGRIAAHWTGDNEATWDNLRLSINGILNSNIVGMTMVGADVCGFINDTTEQLCARWQAAAAMYPFARNHNDIHALVNQEPYRWPLVASITRKALKIRMANLPYLYTQMTLAAMGKQGTMASPVWFFTSDPEALVPQTQWMIGRSIMAAPNVEMDASSVSTYFPPGRWVSAQNMKTVSDSQNVGAWVEMKSSIEDIHVYIKAGSVMPMHSAGLTTAQTVSSDLRLLVIPDLSASAFADGEYIFDGGDMQGSLDGGQYTHVKFTLQNCTLEISPVAFGYSATPLLSAVDFESIPSGCSTQQASISVLEDSTSFTASASEQADGQASFEFDQPMKLSKRIIVQL